MSKNKRRSKSQTSRRKRKQQESTLSSLMIPIIVGAVILAIVVGAVLLNESRLGTTSAAGNISVPVTTAQAQSTSQIPYPNVPRISLDETKSKLDSGQAVLVDVRSRNSYDQSHAVGAISIPEEEVGSHLNELPRDKEIVLYCT
jgi:3-mercaptopyruvate sulfurtransferase SseA